MSPTNKQREARSPDATRLREGDRNNQQRIDPSQHPKMSSISINSNDHHDDLSGYNIENRGLISASQDNLALANRIANGVPSKPNSRRANTSI